MPCRLRRCSNEWCHRAWASVHQERMVRQLDGVGLERAFFLTVTAPGIVEGPEAWNRSAPRRFAALMRDLRAEMAALAPEARAAAPVEYARVLEMQQRGLLHVHAIVTDWRRVPIEQVRLLAVRHGFGPWFEVKPVKDLHAVAGYVASKYLTKSRGDIGRGYRVVQYSQGWAGPWKVATDEGHDAGVWAAALELVDPTVAVLPDGMSWSRWADGEIDAGRGRVEPPPPEWDWRAYYRERGP